MAPRRSGAAAPLSMREAVRLLKAHYGPPVGPPATDPFELVLWENVAYLATPARRREAFDDLVRTVGTRPAQILAARPSALQRITARGILKDTFAAKLRACATIAEKKFGGDLAGALRGPVEADRRALRAFPGIGEPGAEKILLFSGRHPFLAPDSNGLRVRVEAQAGPPPEPHRGRSGTLRGFQARIVRLGLVPDETSYARTYAASRQAAEDLPPDLRKVKEAHLLLRQHGQTLCKRTAPRCGECPLAPSCPYARSLGAR